MLLRPCRRVAPDHDHRRSARRRRAPRALTPPRCQCRQQGLPGPGAVLRAEWRRCGNARQPSMRKPDVTTAILLENIHQSANARLAEAGLQVERRTGALAGAELRQVLADHDVIGIRSATHLRADDIRSAPGLLSIGCFCIGTSQVDLDAATAAGIPVFNAPFSNTRSVAELVVAEAVMLLRRIPEKNTLAHAGKWPRAPPARSRRAARPSPSSATAISARRSACWPNRWACAWSITMCSRGSRTVRPAPPARSKKRCRRPRW
ncbi:protein of unknown function (plasmid) [Cupriavidus taiwanensis]|nr:protein of unknown function [Cupriavidus taiwanensis]